MPRHAHRDHAVLAQRIDIVDRRGQAVERVADAGKQRVPGVGQRQRAAVPAEQREAEMLFEHAELVADRGRRDRQLVRCLRYAKLARGGLERAQRIERRELPRGAGSRPARRGRSGAFRRIAAQQGSGRMFSGHRRWPATNLVAPPTRGNAAKAEFDRNFLTICQLPRANWYYFLNLQGLEQSGTTPLQSHHHPCPRRLRLLAVTRANAEITFFRSGGVERRLRSICSSRTRTVPAAK